MYDMIIRYCGRYGFLPIVEQNGKELYRGEHQLSAEDALERCKVAVDRLKEGCNG